MRMNPPWLLLQLTVTAALTGLCWTVQFAVYGHFRHLFTALGTAPFRAYHAAYVRSIGFVAGPLMVAEAGLAAWACLAAPSSPANWTGATVVILIWALTFGFLVPVHNRLQAAPEPADITRLNRLNHVRTALWIGRLGLLLAVSQSA
jgi:hypothetical protein